VDPGDNRPSKSWPGGRIGRGGGGGAKATQGKKKKKEENLWARHSSSPLDNVIAGQADADRRKRSDKAEKVAKEGESSGSNGKS